MNWQEINAQLNVVLNDRSAEKLSYPTDLRLLSWNRATEHFAVTHTAALKVVTLSTFTEMDSGLAATLPSDLLQLGGVKVDGKWLKPNVIIPGEEMWSSGFIQLSPTQLYLADPETESVTLWYYAFYNKMAVDADVCDLPHWAEWPVINLAVAHILMPNMVGQAIFRQYQPKRDAGDPTDNPPREQALYHLRAYRDGIAGIKPQDRESTF